MENSLRHNETIDNFYHRCNNLSVFNCSENEMLWWLMGSKRLPLKEIIPMSVFLIVIFLTGVIGNVSVCIVIARHPAMHTATNYYLFSLALSDLLLLLFGELTQFFIVFRILRLSESLVTGPGYPANKYLVLSGRHFFITFVHRWPSLRFGPGHVPMGL